MAAALTLIICAADFSDSVSAQKLKEQAKSTICTGEILNSKVAFEAKPISPKAARKAGAKGEVSVMVRVDESGKVYQANACFGHKLLRHAAEDAAYKTLIKPRIFSGKAFKVNGILLYAFVIEKKEGRLVNIEPRSKNH